MKQPRGLTAEEAALWRKVAETVHPLHPPRRHALSGPDDNAAVAAPASVPLARTAKGRVPPLRPAPPPPPAPRTPNLATQGLDSSWDRRLSRGSIDPDVTIDLHGMGLDSAHGRLMGGVAQALAMGARVILLIAGKHRPHGDHDVRGERRGAIRAKLLDWLAASPHADRIAAVRPAQQRHGGAGAVYIVLRRPR